MVNGNKIKCLAITQGPAALPWKELGVDIVVESTGLFTEAAKCKGHLDAGAKKVIISAPGKGEDITIVMGVNNDKYDAAKHHIISNASCTTNCLAPVVHVLLKEGFGIEEGLMTTIHSYTATQKTVDGPSTQGLEGRTHSSYQHHPEHHRRCQGRRPRLSRSKGQANRHGVPGSDTDGLRRRSYGQDDQRSTSYKEICAAMKKASETYLKGILGYTEDEVVSTDFVHDTRSSASSTPAAASN